MQISEHAAEFVTSRILTPPPSVMAPSGLANGQPITWRRTLMACEDAIELARAADPHAKIEVQKAGAVDFPFYIKSERDLVMPWGAPQVLGIIVAPDMREGDCALRLEIDEERISAQWLGRLAYTLTVSVAERVTADWAIVTQHLTPAVCAAYAQKHGWPDSSVMRAAELEAAAQMKGVRPGDHHGRGGVIARARKGLRGPRNEALGA